MKCLYFKRKMWILSLGDVLISGGECVFISSWDSVRCPDFRRFISIYTQSPHKDCSSMTSTTYVADIFWQEKKIYESSSGVNCARFNFTDHCRNLTYKFLILESNVSLRGFCTDSWKYFTAWANTLHLQSTFWPSNTARSNRQLPAKLVNFNFESYCS